MHNRVLHQDLFKEQSAYALDKDDIPQMPVSVKYPWRIAFKVSFLKKTLGIGFHASTSPDTGNGYYETEIKDLLHDPVTNGPGPAEIYNKHRKADQEDIKLIPGLRLTHINDKDLDGISFEETVKLIIMSPRPIKLRFVNAKMGYVDDTALNHDLAEALSKSKAISQMSRKGSFDTIRADSETLSPGSYEAFDEAGFDYEDSSTGYRSENPSPRNQSRDASPRNKIRDSSPRNFKRDVSPRNMMRETTTPTTTFSELSPRNQISKETRDLSPSNNLGAHQAVKTKSASPQKKYEEGDPLLGEKEKSSFWCCFNWCS